MEGGCGWGRLTGDGEKEGFEKGQNGNSGKRRIHHRVYKLSPTEIGRGKRRRNQSRPRGKSDVRRKVVSIRRRRIEENVMHVALALGEEDIVEAEWSTLNAVVA
ncbi:hypothetical protein SDJN03_12766, partial [Cucurbita argyrosperma subsp. sororia]